MEIGRKNIVATVAIVCGSVIISHIAIGHQTCPLVHFVSFTTAAIVVAGIVVYHVIVHQRGSHFLLLGHYQIRAVPFWWRWWWGSAVDILVQLDVVHVPCQLVHGCG